MAKYKAYFSMEIIRWNYFCQNSVLFICTVGQKNHTPINLNAYCHRELKFMPIKLDFWPLQFNALNFVLGVFLHS